MIRAIAVGMLALACAAAGRAQTAADTATGPTVEQVTICTGIADKEPVGAAETFPASVGQLCCYTKVVGAKDTMTIQHKWFHGNELRGTISLPVKAATWRTYSRKMIVEMWTGAWHVDVVDAASGKILGVANFTVQ